MATGLWIASTGAAAQAQNLDVIANNLANSDTPAYKKDVSTFKEYLANVERTHDTADISRKPIQDKDFYPLDGRDQSFVVMDGTHILHQQGHLRVTQGQLDVAIEGPGFLEVNTPQGPRFTRDGSLKIAADGRLVTSSGFPVLAVEPTVADALPNGGINPSLGAAGRYINLRDQGAHFTINEVGEIYAGENLVAKLSLCEFKDMKKLRKAGAQLFENFDPKNKGIAHSSQIRQGLLEMSNVNPVEEMANMIRTNRLFEQDLKALKTYGELMGKEVNEVGKL